MAFAVDIVEGNGVVGGIDSTSESAILASDCGVSLAQRRCHPRDNDHRTRVARGD